MGIFAVFQLSGSTDGLHEKSNFSKVLQGAAGCAEAIPSFGLLPAEASSEDPEVSPVASGTQHPPRS